MMDGGMMDGLMWIGPVLGLVTTLLLLAALALVVVWLWQKVRDSDRSDARRSRSAGPQESSDGPTALEILGRRYARGELSEEKFERMRGMLEDSA